VPGLFVWRRLRLLPLPWLLSGQASRWSTFFVRVEATVAVMAKVGVVVVDAEVAVAFLLLRTWGFFQVRVTTRAGGFFLQAGVAPGVVVGWGWDYPKVPLGAAIGRRPSLKWLPGPGSAKALAQVRVLLRLVPEAGESLGPEFEPLEAGGPLLVVSLLPWLPAAVAPGIPPAAAARPLAFGVLLPTIPRYLESLPNVGFLPRLPLLEMIWNR